MAENKSGTEDKQKSNDELNPILKYANEVEHARSKDDSVIEKVNVLFSSLMLLARMLSNTGFTPTFESKL